MTNKYFFLMASPFEGSDHINPLDRKGPSNGDFLQSGRRHMALVCKKLATDATLDKVLCVCSGRWPVETCTEGLAYKCPSYRMVTTECDMDFGQELPPFLSGDASLEHSGSTFLVEFPFMDFVSFRMPDDAVCFILVFGELLPI